MENVVSYKCPNCAAPLRFDAESGQFLCDSCDSGFTLEEVKSSELNDETRAFDWGEFKQNVSNDKVEGTVTWTCSSCGAEIITDATTAATKCPYCDNVAVIAPNVSGLLKPNAIIPFKVDKKGLKDILAAYFKGKRLLPKDFITENKIKEIKGVYVPFWLYDCHADGSMTFDATRVRTWSDSKYNYTETSYYYVTCDGDMRFERIPVDGSLRIDDALMDSIEPFNYNDLVTFDASYLSGFLADRFDVDAEESLPRASNRVRDSVEQAFSSQIVGYTSVSRLSSNISLDDTNVNYVLLPVYLITSKYNGENYTFAVNGQTGKITGNLPIAKKKFWAWFGGVTAGVAAVCALVQMFLLSGGF